MSAKLTEMQRDMEQSTELSTSCDEEALFLRQKPELMQVQDKADVTLQQWKAQQLQRLAKELKAEWQEARLQQFKDMEHLYLAHLLDEATGQAMGNDFIVEEHNRKGSAKHMRTKERNRAPFREKSRREEHPRQQPKSRKKATCSERRGTTKARGPNPSEKGKGKRVSSSKSTGGYQRVSRGPDINPLLAGAGETKWVEEVQKEIPREGRRRMRRGTSYFVQNINQNSRDQSLQGKTADLEKPSPLTSTFRQEATSPVISSFRQEATSPVISSFRQEATSPVTSSFRQEATSPVISSFRQEATSPVISSFRQEATSPLSSSFRQEATSPLSSTFRQEATSQGAPSKYSDKNQWHKDIESAFEELFNTNRKLKNHLNLHLEQKLKVDPGPDKLQSPAETQVVRSDTPREANAEEAETMAEEPGSPSDMVAHETWSKTDLKQLLGETEYPRYQQMPKHLPKSESLVSVPVAGTSSKQDDALKDDAFSGSPQSGQEPPKSATMDEESLKPYLEEQAKAVASWMAMRQKQKAELEQRRQKTLLEMTEHPDMSLEIHYKAELEEERRERRRLRLALLKTSYSSGVQVPAPSRTISLDSSLLDEDKQSEMIRDLQQQILEQNKLHKQFLEKARKRLQEFQKSF
ncbi:protein DDC8 homolog isoform X1 [Cricetulus griseus]|nr:protein DDC8 homolog isoform X1 [Cricetulus griseus]